MPDALDLLENLENLDLRAIAVSTIEDKEGLMADMNAAQLAMGRRATGTEIRPEYHPLTKELKQGLPGLAGVTDHVTLYDTGDHYRDLYADVQGDEIEHGSKNWKSEKLQNKYGKTIYGLDDENKEELVEGHLRPSFHDKIHEATGL